MTETERPQFEMTSECRTSFFKDVIAGVKKVGSMNILWPCEDDRVSHLTSQISSGKLPSCRGSLRIRLTLVAGNDVRDVGKRLSHFVDKHQVLFKDVLGRNTVMRRPLLILAFDEAHGLADAPESRGWSLYSELCRCLSEIVGLPIFTLFLSTADKSHPFSLPRLSDYSSHVVLGANWVLPPITETGFDQFALDAREGEVTLDRVIKDEWICRLGCPLYVFLTHALWWRTHV
jgi:hypothetical protein